MPDWQIHMRDMAYRWLLEERGPGCLGEAMVMLLGNPDLFRQASVTPVLGELQSEGVFLIGALDTRRLALTKPRFGGPITALYLEVAAMAGIRRVVALGYTGGLQPETAVGTVFVARSALGLDGTTAAYTSGSAVALAGLNTVEQRLGPADQALSAALERALTAAGLRWTAGRIATIDAIMLEDDAVVAALAARGCAAVDLETACLYAVAAKLGIAATSLHLVSDNPFLGDINPTMDHAATFPEALRVAAQVALGV